MRKTLDWEPFYAIAAEPDLPYREKLRAYAAIARERFEADAVRGVLRDHLGHLDEVAWEFFGTPSGQGRGPGQGRGAVPQARGRAVHRAVLARIQAWRAERAAGGPALMPAMADAPADKVVGRWRSERLGAR
jgi:hypothetical protein